MLRKEFYEWLEKKYKNASKSKGTIQSRVSNVARIDKEYDLDRLYAKNQCRELWNDFQYSAADKREGRFPNVDIEIDGDYSNGLSTLRSALKLYIEFLGEPCNQKYISKLKAVKPIAGKAVYKGNLADFKLFFGGFCRNKVNIIAKKERDKQNSICEYCGQKKTLQSAHRTGEERIIIIKNILETHFKIDEDYYEVDLLQFEDLFVKAQTPVTDHFFFLCPKCHESYDAKGKNAGDVTTAKLLAKRAGAQKP